MLESERVSKRVKSEAKRVAAAWKKVVGSIQKVANVFQQRFFLSVIVVCISLSSPNTLSTHWAHTETEWEKKKKDSFYYKALIFWNYFLFKLLCLWEKHTISNFRADFFVFTRRAKGAATWIVSSQQRSGRKLFFMCVILLSTWECFVCYRCCCYWRKLKN